MKLYCGGLWASRCLLHANTFCLCTYIFCVFFLSLRFCVCFEFSYCIQFVRPTNKKEIWRSTHHFQNQVGLATHVNHIGWAWFPSFPHLVDFRLCASLNFKTSQKIVWGHDVSTNKHISDLAYFKKNKKTGFIVAYFTTWELEKRKRKDNATGIQSEDQRDNLFTSK